MGNAEIEREREQEPRCWTIQSQAERRDRGQTEESWLLFEGIDTFLYDLMRKSKIENYIISMAEGPEGNRSASPRIPWVLRAPLWPLEGEPTRGTIRFPLQ